MEIMTTKQASGLWGVTPRRVSEMCRGGRIEGAYKIGTAWVMPADTEKPKMRELQRVSGLDISAGIRKGSNENSKSSY